MAYSTVADQEARRGKTIPVAGGSDRWNQTTVASLIDKMDEAIDTYTGHGDDLGYWGSDPSIKQASIEAVFHNMQKAYTDDKVPGSSSYQKDGFQVTIRNNMAVFLPRQAISWIDRAGIYNSDPDAGFCMGFLNV